MRKFENNFCSNFMYSFKHILAAFIYIMNFKFLFLKISKILSELILMTILVTYVLKRNKQSPVASD